MFVSYFCIRLSHNKTENEIRSENVLKPLYRVDVRMPKHSRMHCYRLLYKGKRPPDFCRHERQRTCFFNFVFFKRTFQGEPERGCESVCPSCCCLGANPLISCVSMNRYFTRKRERERDLFHSVLCVCATTSKWLQCYCALFIS